MKVYRQIGEKLISLFPGFDLSLKHAEINVDPKLYLGKAVVSSIFFCVTTLLTLIILNLVIVLPENFIIFIILIPIFVLFMGFIYQVTYPKLIVSKRINDIESNLLFSLRHLLVEIRSGITLYDSFISLAQRDHGAISEEFKEITKKISVGIPETKALEEVMLKNPSTNFRRVLWQITNALQAGYDISDVLEDLVKELSAEHKTLIRMYGAQLNSFALIYMIFAIILPSIGICFLVILSFFSGFPISTGLLILILLVVIIFQFMFIGIVKSKRPKIE